MKRLGTPVLPFRLGLRRSRAGSRLPVTLFGGALPACVQPLWSRLVSGDFAATADVAKLLGSQDESVRRQARRLFAWVCTHGQVALMRRAVDAADNDQELGFVALALGDTLSPAAIPLLLEVNDLVEDFDARGYVAQGLQTVMPSDGLDEFALEDPDFVERYAAAASELDPDVYRYHGAPAFVGHATKKLVTNCYVSLTEGTEVVFGDAAALVSVFTGIPFPVPPHETVDKALMRAVNEYVRTVARMDWIRGMKYFHGRPVEGPR